MANPNLLPYTPTDKNDPTRSARGYKIYTDPSRTNLVATAADYRKLSLGDIHTLNKAIDDTKQALAAAIKELDNTSTPAPGGAKSAALLLYERFFGTFDTNNKSFVLDGLKKIQGVLNATGVTPPPVAVVTGGKVSQLASKFGPSVSTKPLTPTGPKPPTPAATTPATPATPVAAPPPPGLAVVDATNDDQQFWRNCFAFTYRNGAYNNAVPFFIGRAFFSGLKYVDIQGTPLLGDVRQSLTAVAETRGDATVVTMIHELSHGCFWAVDVPTVASGKVLNANGMPPDNDDPCNDIANDETLAQTYPGLASINADNIGQYAFFAWRRALAAKVVR